MSKLSLRRKSLIWNYLRSYTGVALLTCGIVSLILFRISAAELNREWEKSLENKAELIIEDLGRQYKAFQSVANDVTLDIVYKPTYYRRNKYYETELVESLEKYQVVSSFVQNIFLVYRDSDIIFHESGAQKPQVFFRTILGVDEYDSLLRDIQETEQPRCILPNGRNDVLFLFPVHSLPLQRPYGDILVCFVVPRSTILNRMEDVTGGIDAEVAVFYQDALLTDEMPEKLEAQPDWQLSNGDFSIRVYQNKKVLYGGVVLLQNVNSGFLLLGVLAAMGFAVLMAYRNYRPIQEITLQYGAPDESLDELKALERRIQNTLGHNREIAKQMEQQTDFLRRQLLMLLLRGVGSEETEGYLGKLGFHMEDAWFAVFLFMPQDDNSKAMLEKAKVALEDLSEGELHIYALYPPERNKLIAVVGSNDSDRIAEAPELLKELLETMKFQCRISVGGIYDSVRQLPASWMEAEQAETVNNAMETIGFDKIGYNYLLARRITEDIREGNRMEARRELENFAETLSSYTPPMMKYSSSNLLRALLALNSEIHADIPLDWMHLALTSTEPAEFQKFAEKIVDCLARHVNEQKARLERESHAQIMAHIEENYMDPDLNVASLAESFQMPPREISRICRENVGMNAKEYLIFRRMERAKQLLVEEEMSVGDICTAVGYINISLFFRTFKMQTGFTPLQYRENARRRNENRAENSPEDL
ncbi:MAG: helix-turn-helix domain-containing protein [Eubacteriales bacterium]|nr:helix-turn-helix domain-containing protein [Eubacteriales bacterium]